MDEHLVDFFGFGHGDAAVSNLGVPELRDTSQPLVLKAHLQNTLPDEGAPGETLVNPWLGDSTVRLLRCSASTQRQSYVLFEDPKKERHDEYLESAAARSPGRKITRASEYSG